MKAKITLSNGTIVQSIPDLKGKVKIKPAGTNVEVILDARELYRAVVMVINTNRCN